MRCKMTLRSISHEIASIPKFDDEGKRYNVNGTAATLAFYPVYHRDDPAHENSKFWSATPSGELKLGVMNAEAVGEMVVGKEYYVDIHPAPEV